MQLILNRLGFVSRNAAAYEGKFGVTLRPKEFIAIKTDVRQLLTQDDISNAKNDIIVNAQSQPTYLENEMPLMDAPIDYMHFLVSPTMMRVAAQNSSVENVLKFIECGVATPRSGSVYSVSTFLNAYNAVWNRNSGNTYPGPDSSTVTHVLKSPGHGRLDKLDSSEFNYIPEEGFDGKDSFVIRIESAGRTPVIIHYKVMVFSSGADWGWEHDCKKPPFVPFSQIQPKESDNFNAWLQSAQLSALLAAASQSLTGFQDLAGSSVGQTTGEGSAAQITLDTTAAGHGWYIDPTPLDNTDDYLPTSNPNLWQAKAGSAAEGKMDMLSVLLHEYGHALGLEHSDDPDDPMAPSLQPGQRKLPSTQELALIAELVAQELGKFRADPSQPLAPSDADAPEAPEAPLPSEPWAGLAMAGWAATPSLRGRFA